MTDQVLIILLLDVLLAIAVAILLSPSLLYKIHKRHFTLVNTTKTKITPELLEKLNFTTFKKSSPLLTDSFMLILQDYKHTNEILNINYNSFRAISLSICNDKGKGEYYLFLRQGDTDNRMKDDVVTITRNMLYIEDLEDVIKVLKS